MGITGEESGMKSSLENQLAAIESRFHAVIDERCGFLEWAKDPSREMPRITEELLEKGEREWFAVPGMYGGFAYSLERIDGELTLTTESWCRIWDGSGQRHVITPDRTELVEVGFV